MPNQTTVERRQQILQIANQQDEIVIRNLQSRFDVSEVTLRRDLDYLESQGYIRRVRGGAVARRSPHLDMEFQEKLALNVDEKKEIAKTAASFVKENQVVMLSGGTTTMYIARELCNKRGITIVTPAVNIAAEVAGYTAITLVMIGGVVRSGSYVASGHIADEALMSMHADYAFVGVDGVDFEAGFTTPSLIESRTDAIMLQSATNSIVVADSSKFNKVAFAPVIGLTEPSLFITNSKASKQFVNRLLQLGCNVITSSGDETTATQT